MKSFNDFLKNIFKNPALKYAEKAHSGQTRSDGTPYIKHPERVAKIVKKYSNDKNIKDMIKAAYLHDTIEDTETSKEDLDKMFGKVVSDLVQELTSDANELKKVGKTQYLLNKMVNMSDLALVIKLADRLDNVSDLETAKNPEWREKYRKQTQEILDGLDRKRMLNQVQKRIVAEIRKKIN